MLASWSLSRQVTLPPMRGAQATRNGLLLFALAAFVLLRYSGAVVGAFTGAQRPPGYVDEPPRWANVATICAREVKPHLTRMCCTCASTVRVEMTN